MTIDVSTINQHHGPFALLAKSRVNRGLPVVAVTVTAVCSIETERKPDVAQVSWVCCSFVGRRVV